MKLTEEHVPAVKALLEAGDSYRTIAAAMGCDKGTVSAFAKKHLPTIPARKPGQHAGPEPQPMKILVIDIETCPNLAHVWRLWDQNVSLNQLIESTRMLCWAAKWVGEPLIRFKSEYHHSQDEMIEAAWHLLNRADVVMHYNGKRFDVPHLNREFLRLNLTPPAPYKQIDMLLAVRKQFSFPSYKLAYVAPALGLESKESHEGHELWVKCMAGDKAAWKRMRSYNMQDVVLVEQLYGRLVPWIAGHPSHGAMRGEDVCPACGSDDLTLDGTTFAKTGSYPRFKCEACGKWSRSTKREASTTITEIA